MEATVLLSSLIGFFALVAISIGKKHVVDRDELDGRAFHIRISCGSCCGSSS